MKKYILSILIAFFCAFTVNAQSYTYSNGTYTSTKSGRTANWVETPYTYTCQDGTRYTILVNKNNGRCAVEKVSKKTGKTYKYYIPDEEICRDVCKRMNIAYTYTPKRK